MPSTVSDQISFKRSKPCQRCRIQRRRCDRPSGDAECARCIKSNRECINEDGVNIDDDSIDGRMDLQRLTAQVAHLQQNLHHMESHLQRQYTSDTSLDKNWEETAITTWNQPFNGYDEPQSSADLKLVSPTMTASSSASVTDETSDDINYQWDLTLVNGQLRLDSSISNFEELIAYGHALQKYLSPFSGVFDNTSFLFEMIQPQSFLPMAIQIVSKTSPPRRRKKLNNGTSMLNKYHFMLKRHHPGVLLAAEGKPPPLSCIEEYLKTYFTCFNPALPLIHAPSYFAEYESMVRPDPTQHALTMAICSMVSSSTCQHLKYDNYEKRILADYFYQRTIDLLMDFFDDPDRRLETIMVINFMTQYQQTTLRVAEARKWCTIAFMIATDLKKENRYTQQPTNTDSPIYHPSPFSTSSTSSTFPPSPAPSETTLSSLLVPSTTNIEAAMFGRHYVMSLCNQKFLDLIVAGNPETWEFLNSCPILYVEDECETSYTFIGAYNSALQLMAHPVVLEMKEQTFRMHLGETAKVSLELILRFDQVYQEWWKELPAQCRLCDQDPADVTSRPLVEQCDSQIQLIIYILAVSHKAEANLALTKPSNQSMISQGGNYEMIRAIQERALNEAYECIESLIIAMKRVDSRREFCVFASGLLLIVSDLLCTLAACSSVSVKERSQQKLMESLRELRQVHFMEGNLVPPSLSPLSFMDSASPPPNVGDLDPNILDMYNEYTFPCLAFGYDVIRKASEDE